MKNTLSTGNRIKFGIRTVVCGAVLGAVMTAGLPWVSSAEAITAVQVPDSIAAPLGHKAFLVGHATGTQNYICKQVGAEIKFMLFTPEAVLSHGDQQLTSHFFSPNPSEANTDSKVLSQHTIRPTWRHSRDTSTIWAKAVPNAASAAPDAIPWLLLQVVGAQRGPRGGDTLTETTFIQRINTTGGLAPATGCTSPSEIGNQAFVPYTADYVFFKKAAETRTSGHD